MPELHDRREPVRLAQFASSTTRLATIFPCSILVAIVLYSTPADQPTPARLPVESQQVGGGEAALARPSSSCSGRATPIVNVRATTPPRTVAASGRRAELGLADSLGSGRARRRQRLTPRDALGIRVGVPARARRNP